MKIQKAFSLVELIVVVAIISIIWTVSFSHFSNFSDNQKLKNINSDFLNNIKNFDNQVKINKIFDYKIYLNSNSLWYIISENELNNVYNQKLNLNYNSLSWTLNIPELTWTWFLWNIKIYKDLAQISNFKINKNNFSYKFDWNNFFVESKVSWKSLNTIRLNYFSDENFDKYANNSQKVYLSSINSKQNKTWEDFSQITIENMNNKKYIKNNSWRILKEVFLFFQNWWKENFLKIWQ